MLVYEYTRISHEYRMRIENTCKFDFRSMYGQFACKIHYDQLDSWLGLSAEHWMIVEQQLNTGRHLFCYAMFRDGFGLV